MQIKTLLFRLERKLENKFSEIKFLEIYYSRRRKFIHIAFDKPINHFSCKNDLIKEIKFFYEENFRKDFFIIEPMKLINTIKWKFDYVIFRKR